jgi:hypothetical protein
MPVECGKDLLKWRGSRFGPHVVAVWSAPRRGFGGERSAERKIRLKLQVDKKRYKPQ